MKLIVLLLFLSFFQKPPRTLFESSVVHPEGFLGIRLGNSFRYAEDVLGEPDVVRNDSLYWQFSSADYEPFESITVLGSKGKITGFVANIKASRIKFSELELSPQQNRFGVFYATRSYLTQLGTVKMMVTGPDDTYIARIVISCDLR
ncbi:MAG: hypothetical protein RMM17_01365 [Acidobacteriota bacterium]|nr:hypothetical protein [Blastocatellia bacterium]MDW8411318.1 hypothetical protein [Acidobacteriota bacterium]